MTENNSFPPNFTWGAAMASWQVEGAAKADGKGLSIWDTAVHNAGDSLDITCDHYNHYPEDMRLMAELGLQAHRLTISWPRVLPEGVGTVNEKGLDFYDRLVDELLKHAVEPWVDLFHWDFPDVLYRQGGWLNRESANWFAEFTAVVIDRLSDRVTHWITINEPQCFVGLGHLTGINAPCLKLPLADVLMVGHHALLAHGMSVQTIRVRAKRPARVGAALVGLPKMPASSSLADIAAAKAAFFAVEDDIWNTTWFADPIYCGCYPEDGLQRFGKDSPKIQTGDMETICQPLDYFGVNIYHGAHVRANGNGRYETLPFPDGHPLTMLRWPITPETLYWGPRFLHERYKLPIVITENGMANTDWVHVDGRVHDPQRIDFITRHLRAFKRAIDEGVEALGYFHWAFLDNYEWPEAYDPRFGLVYVDYQTQQRIPKDSAYWYREIICSNGAILGDPKDSFINNFGL